METPVKDIENIDDIKKLVDTFYGKINVDPMLSPIFNKVANVDWDTHLLKMYEFWNMIIFGARNYQGSPMGIHIHLSTLTTMHQEQFEQWKKLFFETLDELFVGTNADEAKKRATTIASTMQHKIKNLEQKAL